MKSAIIPCSTPTCHSPSWKNQLANAVTDPQELLRRLQLNQDVVGSGGATQLFKLRVPEPYIRRMEVGNPKDPLFLQVWPQDEEYLERPDFVADPLQESHYNPVPGLLHKYGKRVLTINAASCAINCRYCFRRHFDYPQQSAGEANWTLWTQYIAERPEIDEIILSGGEPLLLSDEKLARLHQTLEQLPQLKRLRIHSRLPLVIPDRISDGFLTLAEQSRLKWVLVWHINHPNEIDQEVIKAAHRCHQAGIHQLNQSVLLKGVNDNTAVLAELSERLLTARIQPYYLFLLDKVAGTHHFEVAEHEALRLYQQLEAEVSGYLLPKLAREIPGKASKTQVYPLLAL
jgi:EF-P beta-lysylation protein EpmB